MGKAGHEPSFHRIRCVEVTGRGVGSVVGRYIPPRYGAVELISCLPSQSILQITLSLVAAPLMAEAGSPFHPEGLIDIVIDLGSSVVSCDDILPVA